MKLIGITILLFVAMTILVFGQDYYYEKDDFDNDAYLNEFHRTYRKPSDLEKNLLAYTFTEVTPIRPEPNKTIEFINLGALYEVYYPLRLRELYKNDSYTRFGFNMIIDGKARSLAKTDLGVFFNQYMYVHEIHPDILIGPQYTHHSRNFLTYQALSSSIMFTTGPTWLPNNIARQFNVVGTQPSNLYRLEALTSFLKHLKWNYITLISSVSMEETAKRFINDKKDDFCFGSNTFVNNRAGCNAIKVLGEMEEVRVIVLLTVVEDSKHVLDCMRKAGYEQRFELVFFYNHNVDYNVVHGNEDLVENTFSLRTMPLSPHDLYLDPDFWVFAGLTGEDDTDRHVLAYWELRNKCYGGSGFFPPSNFMKNCTFSYSSETLEPENSWEFAPYLITESTSMMRTTNKCIFHLLKLFLSDYCNGTVPCTRSIIGPNFRQLFAQKIRETIGDDMTCSRFLGRIGYIVYNPVIKNHTNIYKNETSSLQPNLVYQWYILGYKGGSLNDEDIYGNDYNFHPPQFAKNKTNIPFGNCTHECDFGLRKVVPNSDSRPVCCFSCVSCGKNDNEVLNSSSQQCYPCKSGERANRTTGACDFLPLRMITDVYLSHLDYSFVVIGVLVVISFVLLIWVYRRTNCKMFIVSSKTTWVVLIFSVVGCLASAISFAVNPSDLPCVFQNYTAPTFLGIIHIVVILKSIRIVVTLQRQSSLVVWVSRNSDVKTIEMSIGIILFVISAISAAQANMTQKKFRLFKTSVFHKLTTGEEFMVMQCIASFNLVAFIPVMFYALFSLVFMFFHRNLANVYREPWDILMFSFSSLFCCALFVSLWVTGSYTKAFEYYQELCSCIFLIIECLITLFFLFWRKVRHAIKGLPSSNDQDSMAVWTAQ